LRSLLPIGRRTSQLDAGMRLTPKVGWRQRFCVSGVISAGPAPKDADGAYTKFFGARTESTQGTPQSVVLGRFPRTFRRRPHGSATDSRGGVRPDQCHRRCLWKLPFDSQSRGQQACPQPPKLLTQNFEDRQDLPMKCHSSARSLDFSWWWSYEEVKSSDPSGLRLVKAYLSITTSLSSVRRPT